MFEDSPRATKRRRLANGNDAVDRSPTPANGQRSRSATPGFIAAESRFEDEFEQLTGDTTLMSTKKVRSNRRGGSQELERAEAHLLETPSRIRTVKLADGQPDRRDGEVELFSGQGGEENGQAITNGVGDDEQDTIELSQSNRRTSQRLRKTTWKIAEPVPASTSSTRQTKSPTSLRRPQKRQLAAPLSPIIQEGVLEEPASSPAAVAAAALNAVSGIASAPTPTPKKRGRPRKDKQPVSVLDLDAHPLEGDELAAPTLPTPTPKKRARQQKAKQDTVIPIIEIDPALEAHDAASAAALQSASIQDEMVLDASPFKTKAPDLTPTPRKRGRPPKAKVVDEFGFTAVDPLASAAKRQRTTLALDSEDVDPLAAFTRRDPATIAARKSMKDKMTPTKAKAVSWQDFKDIETAGAPRPDIEDSHATLQELLQNELYHGPLRELKAGIIRSLMGKRRMPLQGLDDECQKVRQLIEQTVVAGEGNSMFLIGPRGSGKSALVETVINEISSEHKDEFHVIRLNGFIHTDDKLALREIWRQLGKEMELEDSMLERSNYADTLTSLLAVLSHPADQDSQQQTGQQQTGDQNAAHEHQAAKSVVFIIDEFDLFTSHARQTLLYNLFDIAQARKAPIAVLGLTTRVDVTESLEKRVKSRFSHRSVFLPRPKSFPAFQQIIIAALTSSSDSAVPLVNAGETEEAKADAYRTLHEAWSSYISSLFHTSTAISATLRTIYATSRSVPIAMASFLLFIANFTPDNIPLDSKYVSQALLPPDSKLNLLHSLTDLELSLLIAATRLDIILNVDTCNFNMAYDEYTTLVDRTKVRSAASGVMALGGGAGGGRVWSREAALGAWEKLEILELIMPLATAGYGAGAGLADVGRAGKLVRCDVSMEEIRYSGVQMNSVMMRWCKEI